VALKALRFFISSPGDVAEERLIARRVIGRLDSQFGDVMRLEAFVWEHQPLVATASFQEQLANPSEADVVVLILWSRLGTALPSRIRRNDGSRYASGTEFEFEAAVAGFRRNGTPSIVAYRKTAKPDWSADAAVAAEQLQQKHALERFIANWFTDTADGSFKAAFHPFASPADFEELLEAHLTKLVERHLPPGFRAHALRPTWRHGSPFRGLQPFEAEHAPVFFGRTAAVASALQKLRRQAERGNSFLLIVGMSGGGKSSLVRAGVLPVLLQPGVVGAANLWCHAIMRPSEGRGDLIAALTRALRQPTALPALADGEPESLVTRVNAALDELARAQGAVAGVEYHVALVVDQLEEIFSDEQISARERQTFIELLATLARSGRACVLATLRSDVYPRLAELPVLIDLKEGDGQFDLLPPAPREIGQIIRSPAAAAGLRFEVREHTLERLDETIRDAAAKNPAALPLLEFLLEELYKKRSSEDVLTFRAYEELGGVEGALAQRAEQVVTSLSAAAQAAVPAVFHELVALGIDDTSKVLRRTAHRKVFTTPQASELVNALLAARLLVSAVDASGEPVISLAHEALLEFWPRLAEWRERNRENLHIHARLTAAAQTWERHGRSADFLLARGKPLAEARTLIAEDVRLAESEAQLVKASEHRSRQFARLRAAVVAALAVLAVGASVAAYLAQQQSNLARTQATTAQRTTDFMVDLFTLADPEENRGATVTVREILDRGVTQVRGSLAGEQEVRGNLLRAMGQAYNGLGLYPRARELLAEAAAAAKRSGVAEDILKADLSFAANRYADGDYAQAENVYRRALNEAERLQGERHRSVTQAMNGLAESLYGLNKPTEAEPLYRRALDLDLTMHGEQDADTARSLNGLGWFLYFEGRYGEAEPVWQRALLIRQGVYGARHSKTSESLNNLASLYFQEGKYDKATDAWTETLRADRAVFGDDHPNTAATLNNLGRAELLRGDLVGARTHLTETMAIYRRRLAPGHESFAIPLNSLAMIAIERGELAEAEQHLREALDIARARHHWILDQVLANCGDLYVRAARLSEAATALDEAQTTAEKQYGAALKAADGWRVAILESIRGGYFTETGDFADAERLLLHAQPVLRQRFGERGLYANQTAARLERLYTKWGRPADAERWQQQAAAPPQK
jgi:tetratricopeptide (TPR) repeat protein